MVLIVSAGGPASAHETRATNGVELVVGWGEEPAYTGVRNSVQVTVREAGGAPVTDLGGSLQVEVGKGEDRVTLPLDPAFRVGGFGTPGDYRAPLTPTRPGAYQFRVTGTIRGQSVDQTFSSSPTTFDEVQDAADIQFPAGDPSTGQLAARLDREVPRLQAALREADDQADSARTLATFGLVAGALGLLAAAASVVAARRAPSLGAGANGRGEALRREQPAGPRGR